MTELPARWVWSPFYSRTTCPPDPMAGPWYKSLRPPMCANKWHHWYCTRPAHHTARHAASDGSYILAVWP